MTLCVAHRGGSLLAPENTLAAFASGVASGADWVEADVHRTRDGALVVIHDDDLSRTTDLRGAVGSLTLAEVRQANAAAKFPGRRFPPQRVPTLDEVVEALPERIGLQVEIKVPESGPYRDIERQVVDCLVRAGMQRRASVICFDAGVLVRVRETAAGLATGFLVSSRHVPRGSGGLAQRIVDAARACSANFAGLDVELVSRDVVADLRDAGLGVAAWTVNDRARMLLCRDLVLDAIASDRPDELRRVLDDRG